MLLLGLGLELDIAELVHRHPPYIGHLLLLLLSYHTDVNTLPLLPDCIEAAVAVAVAENYLDRTNNIAAVALDNADDANYHHHQHHQPACYSSHHQHRHQHRHPASCPSSSHHAVPQTPHPSPTFESYYSETHSHTAPPPTRSPHPT